MKWNMISDYSNCNNNIVSKSPRYTGGDFMFLYWFVCRRRRPQILVYSITFEQHFGFLIFLARFLALDYRWPHSMLVDCRRDLDLEFSRSNMEFAISQPKMVRLPRNEKQIYWMTMTVPILWPRSGVRICQIVTGVTSDVGVPSTHLFYTHNGNYEADAIFKSFNS